MLKVINSICPDESGQIYSVGTHDKFNRPDNLTTLKP